MNIKERQVCVTVYNCVLKHMGQLEGRGYKKVSSFDNVTKSVYFKLVFALTHRLLGEKIDTYREIDNFFYKGRLYGKEDFEPSLLLSNFDLIKELDYKEETIHSIYRGISNSIDVIVKILDEDCLEYSDLLKGKPPLIMKLWKFGKIDVYTMLVIVDYMKIQKESWFKLACGAKKSDVSQAIHKIKKDTSILDIVESFLEKNIDYIK